MLDKVRNRLTYANVMSTIALFVALGGSSYAAMQINSGDIQNNSVRGVDVRNRTLSERDIRRNSLGGRSIKESRLGRVPHARNADRLGGMSADQFVVACPQGTFAIADVCIEMSTRPRAAYGAAVIQCATTDFPATPGRRLPTHGELQAALTGVQLAPGGELTSEMYMTTMPAALNVLYITDQAGSVGSTTDTGAGAKAFRCVADPLN